MVETEAPRSRLGGEVRPGLLVAGLSVVVLTVAVLQTAVVPVLGIIAHQLNVSTVAVSWAVTANLLAAAAATPLIGRLADQKTSDGTDLVIVSHGNPLRAVSDAPYLAEGEAAVIRPLGAAGFRIVARIPKDGWDSLGAP